MAAFVALTSEEQAGLATSGLIVGGVKALLDRAKPLPTQTEGSCPVNLPTQTTTTVSQPTVPQKHFPTENPSIPQEQLTPTDVPLPLVVNSKSESPIWKTLNPFRGKTKTNGLSGKKRRYYEWDYTHGDIEVYDGKGNHVGSMDPVTGQMTKPAVRGRNINGQL